MGAQALGRLKPQEVRCLLLRAEGYSYREICAETGWTYTKVNRCLAEGRRAFLERLAGIESGTECERLAPGLSALADGEASAADLAALRPHLRTCLACRARLREYRAVPDRLGALVPIGVLSPAAGDAGPVRGALEWAVSTVHERAAHMGDKAQQAADLTVGGKAAAVAASAAALAGGGAATVEHLSERAAEAGAAPAAQVRPEREEPAPPAPERRARAAAHDRRRHSGARTGAGAQAHSGAHPQPRQRVRARGSSRSGSSSPAARCQGAGRGRVRARRRRELGARRRCRRVRALRATPSAERRTEGREPSVWRQRWWPATARCPPSRRA